jgi:hypothetical protein
MKRQLAILALLTAALVGVAVFAQPAPPEFNDLPKLQQKYLRQEMELNRLRLWCVLYSAELGDLRNKVNQPGQPAQWWQQKQQAQPRLK